MVTMKGSGNMKPYELIGGIVVFIGLIVICLGLVKVYEVYTLYSEWGMKQILGSAYLNTAMWKAFEPYLLPAILCFGLGGVGLAIGSSKKEEQTKLVLKPVKDPAVDALFESQPNASNNGEWMTICGKCSTMNEIDATFCKRCGNSLRA